MAHGFCALAIADNGNIILIDCGHENGKFSPSEFLHNYKCSGIETLIISNYDEDHVSDLPNIVKDFEIEQLISNRSITPTEIKKLKQKSGVLSFALDNTIELCNEYNILSTKRIDFAGLHFYCYFNTYPEFSDTNNLSVVTFFEYGGIKIVYPGDIEKEGWDKLLKQPDFLKHLRGVNIFIASHHGRENGYNEKVFNYCTPDVVIISDKNITYNTQQNIYAKHAKGIIYKKKKRFVLTTRTDGTIDIFSINGSFRIF